MDLESLRCFDAAAATLNFRAAAGRVHLSPAAFSDRVQRLEDALGVPLFVRTTRAVALSAAGTRLLPLAREVLAGVERLRALGSGGPAAYELTVGTRYELGLSWLCPALEPLARRRPERTIHLYNGDSPDLLLRLERGDLDAIVASMRLTSPKLTYAALHPEEYVLVTRRARLRRRDDARALTLVDVSRDLPLFRYFLDALPDAEPWPFARVEYMGGIGNIRRRVLDGGGRVAVLPRYFVRDDLAARRLVRLLPRVRLRSDSFRLVWRTGHPRTDALLALADELRAYPPR
jgi:LysR family transcriptional regulator, glycine cleavage system transcriptional activator